MNSLCCTVVLAEVQGMGDHAQAQCSSCAESPGGVQCLCLMAEEGKEEGV